MMRAEKKRKKKEEEEERRRTIIVVERRDKGVGEFGEDTNGGVNDGHGLFANSEQVIGQSVQDVLQDLSVCRGDQELKKRKRSESIKMTINQRKEKREVPRWIQVGRWP